MSAFVEETLVSLVASTYRPLEILVVNDGSKDDSAEIVEQFARKHSEVRLIRQTNSGVSAARNNALRQAQGKYILPVDADDKIAPNFIAHAVEQMEQNPALKIVCCRAEFFGEKTGEWKLPPYSPALLARKNMIPATALFRKEDALRFGGYATEEVYREDWDFWLSIMEHGGDVVRLDEIGFFYRIRTGSRRTMSHNKKREMINLINKRHPQFMLQHLGGPLHYHRTWSSLLNRFRSEKQVGTFDAWLEGAPIYQGRNTLCLSGDTVIKHFAIPSIWRGIIYGWFCKSKARRSYEYAVRLGELTPAPVAYREERIFGILRHSEYACRQSECQHTFNELIGNKEFPNRAAILQAIGRFTAQMHEAGALHGDYSGGNILFNEDGSKIEVIDLNRIRWKRHIGQQEGCRNMERLNIDREALILIAEAYAQARGLNPEECADYVVAHRWKKHVRKGITNL